MYNQGYPYPLNASMVPQVIRHPTATPREVVTDIATDGVDLTVFVQSVSQNDQNVSIKLAWHMELYDPTAQPRVGEWISIKVNGLPLWNGIVQGITDYGESRSDSGSERRMTITARSRDATAKWRETRIVTNIYSMGTDLVNIARDTLTYIGLTEDEWILPPSMGVFTVHSSLQMAEVTPWDVLTAIGFPAGLEPYVDAIGRFKFISRSVTAAPARVLTPDRLRSVSGSKEKPKITKMLIKWLDPNLTKSAQQDQVLGTATITAGFFQLKQEQDVYFSSDRTQRAENTRMVIKQSCNSGLLDVADEEYAQLDFFHGKITLTTAFWVPLLAIDSIAGMIAATYIPDGVTIGSTIPVGRLVHGIAEATIMVIMMSIGTGVYEVWGVPYDYVHATNRTEAYVQGAPEWAEVIEDESNDFIMNEAMAQATATRELVYRYRSASSYNFEVVEDTSLEHGDIIQLPDGSKAYITGVSRTLTRGQSHLLNVTGFLV